MENNKGPDIRDLREALRDPDDHVDGGGLAGHRPLLLLLVGGVHRHGVCSAYRTTSVRSKHTVKNNPLCFHFKLQNPH